MIMHFFDVDAGNLSMNISASSSEVEDTPESAIGDAVREGLEKTRLAESVYAYKILRG